MITMTTQATPPGPYLALTTDDATIELYVVDAYRSSVATFTGHSKCKLRTVCFSVDSTKLAAGDENGVVIVWDIVSKEQLAVLSKEETHDLVYDVVSVCFNREGDTLICKYGNGTVTMWDISAAKEVTSVACRRGYFSGAHYTADYEGIVTADVITKKVAGKVIKIECIAVWNSDMTAKASLPTSHLVNDIAVSPLGDIIAIATDTFQIAVWDIIANCERTSLVGHTASVRRVSFDSDGSRLVSSSTDQTIRWWNILGNGEELRCHCFDGVAWEMALCTANNYVACYISQQRVVLFDIETGQQQAEFEDMHVGSFSCSSVVLM
jgi:WD40 repeat protein